MTGLVNNQEECARPCILMTETVFSVRFSSPLEIQPLLLTLLRAVEALKPALRVKNETKAEASARHQGQGAEVK